MITNNSLLVIPAVSIFIAILALIAGKFYQQLLLIMISLLSFCFLTTDVMMFYIFAETRVMSNIGSIATDQKSPITLSSDSIIQNIVLTSGNTSNTSIKTTSDTKFFSQKYEDLLSRYDDNGALFNDFYFNPVATLINYKTILNDPLNTDRDEISFVSKGSTIGINFSNPRILNDNGRNLKNSIAQRTLYIDLAQGKKLEIKPETINDDQSVAVFVDSSDSIILPKGAKLYDCNENMQIRERVSLDAITTQLCDLGQYNLLFISKVDLIIK